MFMGVYMFIALMLRLLMIVCMYIYVCVRMRLCVSVCVSVCGCSWFHMFVVVNNGVVNTMLVMSAILYVWRCSLGCRSIHVYSNAPSVTLFVNGKSVGSASIDFFGTASFNVTYAAGNLTAVGYASDGTALASFTRLSYGAATALRVAIDAPNVNTGTGSALVADGEDTAMVRAEVCLVVEKRPLMHAQPRLRRPLLLFFCCCEDFRAAFYF